jgi:multiple sugar transport system substrate-binding protein
MPARGAAAGGAAPQLDRLSWGRSHPSRHGPGRRRIAFLLVVGLLLLAAACGGRTEATGVPTLRWYTFREPSGAYDAAVAACTEAAAGRYTIEMAYLPAAADQQREQLVRRLAAGDRDIDLMSLDVIWTPEFAEAGWVLPWDGAAAEAATAGRLAAPVETATWDDGLWAAPFTTNTQLLWYRTDLVDEPPQTWDEMLDRAEALAAAGEPHTVQVQGNRYEGLTVWFVSLIQSARGSVLAGDGRSVALAPDATRRALSVMNRLATSPAASPTLSTAQEDSTRLAFEAGSAAFMVNYTFVWPSAQANAPEIAEEMGWARWPRVLPDEPSHVTVGGINLGVGAFSRHPGLAFEAAACLASPANQRIAAVRGGLLPTTAALYDDPAVEEAFPFADLLRQTLEDASLRPETPAYNDVSLAIQRVLHPPRRIDPEEDVEALRERVGDAIHSRGLL